MNFSHSENTQGYIERVKAFMDDHISILSKSKSMPKHMQLNPGGDYGKIGKRTSVNRTAQTESLKKLDYGIYFYLTRH